MVLLILLFAFIFALSLNEEQKKKTIKQVPASGEAFEKIPSIEAKAEKDKKEANRENAVILVLCRNRDLEGIKKSINSLERIFNRRYNYPYVFLNDKDFTDQFKEGIRGTIPKSKVEFGKIDESDWKRPDNIDMIRASIYWNYMAEKGIPYAALESYHNMCRFYSRKFYDHPLVQKYRYYWRIEPDVEFFNILDFDPFVYMRTNKKKYSFVIALNEFQDAIKTLFSHFTKYIANNWNELKGIDRMEFIIDRPTETIPLRSRINRIIHNESALKKKSLESLKLNNLIGNEKAEESQQKHKLFKKTGENNFLLINPLFPDNTLGNDGRPMNMHIGSQDDLIKDLQDYKYNGCHFWSNFEIADFSFYRNKHYRKLMDILEAAGGFYYERWGDAPVHTLAAWALLNKNEIHYFHNIGYKHSIFQNCPSFCNMTKCGCKPGENIPLGTCMKNYLLFDQ